MPENRSAIRLMVFPPQLCAFRRVTRPPAQAVPLLNASMPCRFRMTKRHEKSIAAETTKDSARPLFTCPSPLRRRKMPQARLHGLVPGSVIHGRSREEPANAQGLFPDIGRKRRVTRVRNGPSSPVEPTCALPRAFTTHITFSSARHPVRNRLFMSTEPAAS